MRVRLEPESIKSSHICTIEEIAADSIYKCYQCGKCSSACPSGPEMDLQPNQLIRLLQLGLYEKVLSSQTPWFCASCMQCRAGCPKGVDLARIMEGVRMVQLRAGVEPVKVPTAGVDTPKNLPQMALIAANRKFSSLS